ncbi:unnamed protein product [Parascedosporium putredinis]|uniref:Uncharacterized protein n=1 Tax=Parascedosporium putredinis TaxID=1442378 RepID=A0A9P1HAW8_9PEZI|nr:unnamed protein product [Parascedosporium putredinis]CAI8001755.1 unnamed protein product [Parascedosporium putredinis]
MGCLDGQTALITGASMGIGEAIALALAKEGANLILISRSEDKLLEAQARIKEQASSVRTLIQAVNIQDAAAVDKAVEVAVAKFGQIDILVNNAGLALGAPARFWELPIATIDQMNGTNVAGVMYTTHSVLNRTMWPRKTGTILNAVYHANKASLEAFSNSLRMETAGSDIRVLVLRPGCVATHFHLQRVEYDKDAMDEFFYGYEPLVPEDLAEAVIFMVGRVGRTSIKALDCVPTAQRGLRGLIGSGMRGVQGSRITKTTKVKEK